MNSSIPIYKIVVLGEGRVGKTSLTLKYVKNQFHDNQQSSINACYLQKDISLPDYNNRIVRLSIWDTAGQQKYNAVAPVYYRDALGAIVVYEITSNQSFDRVMKWVEELREHANNKDMVIVLAGNKCDMETHRKVPISQAEKYAKEKGVQHVLVSAKNGLNVSQLFKIMANKICKQSLKGGGKMLQSSKRSPKLKLQIAEKEDKKKQKKPCC